MKNKIYDPLQDGISEIEYIQHCGNDKMIVNAARVSYANDTRLDEEINEKDIKLLKFLIQNDHGTPFEHNLITFRIKTPLYVIQEMLRHRIGTSFNQESHRYIEPGKNINTGVIRKFYIPNEFRLQDNKNKQSSKGIIENNEEAKEIYLRQCEQAFDAYNELISRKVCREQARGVLPHCTYSSLYFTVNLRSFIHFSKLRLSKNAQWEIRQYAKYMLEICKPLFPGALSVLSELNILNYEDND